ncbi:1396_t:CDS:2 [Funneliformis geosporum]|nr:1396_t:CDS:2 [Funneliformis geosporum]
MILQDYNYEIIHKKGKYNSVPNEEKDALLKRTQEIMENNDAYEIQQQIKIQQAKRKQKNVSEKFKIGNKVLLHQTHLENNFSAKLEAKWIRPYFIHEVYKKNNYKLQILEEKLLKNSVYENRLKMYYEETLEP